MKRQISNLAGLDQSSRIAQKRYTPKRKTKDTSVAALKKEMFRLKKQMLVTKPPMFLLQVYNLVLLTQYHQLCINLHLQLL